MTAVTVSFEVEEIAVIWELLRNVRLGDRNNYEEAVSNLMIELEDSGIEDRLNTWYMHTDNSAPEFMIESSNDGFVINVN